MVACCVLVPLLLLLFAVDSLLSAEPEVDVDVVVVVVVDVEVVV